MGLSMNPWIILLITATAAAKLADVHHLRGEGDFRFATLRWDYPKHIDSLFGFQIHYCELQAWGSNRCRTKVVERSLDIGEEPTAGTVRQYSVVITGLKMSTNYTFEVRPMETRRTRYLADKTHSTANSVVVNTKGFSAVAKVCLPDSSEVEVSTGPYFSGRIGVESTRGLAPECSLTGDGSSPNSSYVLRISHTLCGSVTNATSVATFILVQENLPILTHSTRRFLVLCTFHPETLTVRAGLNLPGTGVSATGSGSVETESTDTEIEQLPELTGNEVHAMPLLQELQMAAARRHHKQSDNGGEIVLTTIAVVVAIVGLLLAVWWFHPRRSSSGSESILNDEIAESICDDPMRESYITDEERSSDESNKSKQVFSISKHLQTTTFCQP